jgi:hypothetical protein
VCAVVRVQQRVVANRGTEDPSSLRERTCDQLPGAAHRSTARTTSGEGGDVRQGPGRGPDGGSTFENIKIFIDLKQLEGRASPPAFLLGFPVVNILFKKEKKKMSGGLPLAFCHRARPLRTLTLLSFDVRPICCFVVIYFFLIVEKMGNRKKKSGKEISQPD